MTRSQLPDLDQTKNPKTSLLQTRPVTAISARNLPKGTAPKKFCVNDASSLQAKPNPHLFVTNAPPKGERVYRWVNSTLYEFWSTNPGSESFFSNFKDVATREKRILTYIDGQVIEGSLKNLMLQGKGRISFKSGTVFEGNFVNHILNGRGKKTMCDGRVLEGEFRENVLTKGKVTLKHGDIFEGQFVNDKLHGKGTKYLRNGDVFSGFLRTII